ncbi:MAG: hypothetical protein KatS3mg123_2542 [Burkholderiales bacterium]|nr:MAG: hypothetical protein KatS3mg123_2542 [Burkholderiales bacterium]
MTEYSQSRGGGGEVLDGGFARVLETSLAAWSLYGEMDAWRRAWGRALDAVGLGPQETPGRVVLARPPVTLKAYHRPAEGGPAVLLVPAPFKRAYLWDLAPRASVVRRCLEAGFRVYLLQWEPPGEAEAEYGLAQYAGRLLLEALEAVAADGGAARPGLIAHSLGGTFAAAFTAAHPERVGALALLAAPLHFGEGIGAFGRTLAALSRTGLPERLPGNVPGSYLNTLSVLASPKTFQLDRWLDWLSSMGDAEAAQTHLRVERWALDETPLPRKLFAEIAAWLYREDRFMRGTLELGGRRAAPERLAIPVLCAADPRCDIVPPQSVVPFYEALPGANKALLWYHGDTGVAIQHVGLLVGRNAHRRLWPEILRWLSGALAHDGSGKRGQQG